MRHHIWFHAVAPAGLVAMAALLTSTFGASTAVARQYSAGPPRGGTIHVGFSGSVVTLDPSQAYNDDWWLINGTLFNGLYQFDRQGVPQRDLADGPPTIS